MLRMASSGVSFGRRTCSRAVPELSSLAPDDPLGLVIAGVGVVAEGQRRIVDREFEQVVGSMSIRKMRSRRTKDFEGEEAKKNKSDALSGHYLWFSLRFW